MKKERPEWRLQQWQEAMRWYLRWLEICESSGAEVHSVAQRMQAAIESAGARRGLALRTRQCYASWVVRYGQWAGGAKRAMDPAVARDFLAYQVSERKVSFQTQLGQNRRASGAATRRVSSAWQRGAGRGGR